MQGSQIAYQYGVGGVFFAVTLYLCFRPGASDLKSPTDRKTLWLLLVGFVGYFLFHLGWIVLAHRSGGAS